MPFRLQPSKTDGSAGDVPDVVNIPVATGETFRKGTVLQLTSGELEEVAADTTTGLYAVSLEDAEDGSPDNPSDDLTAARINLQTAFYVAVYDSGAGAVVTDLSTISVGDTGDAEVVNDVYYFDTASSASAVFEVVAIEDDLNLLLVKFIESTIA